MSQPTECRKCVHFGPVTSMAVDPKHPLFRCKKQVKLRIVESSGLPIDCPGGEERGEDASVR